MVRLARRACAIAVLLAGAWQGPLSAADDPAGITKLKAFLDGAQSMQARFRQELVNGEETVQEARGRFALKRPGRFRWDYQEPYERVVVGDGERLWLYEADLEQVTVRPLTAGLGETPAGLLTGERNVLDRFEYVSSWSAGGVSWVRLKPRSAESDFDSIAIGFSGDRPVQLELNDRLGQQTRVFFSDIVLNRPVDDATFRFDVPEGVDVIREGEL